ncbi:hypothetical protein GW17_00018988 [Ensete ventricosum]|nr:hypothetical protein GW17_00018988 [Ensete ventricosum]
MTNLIIQLADYSLLRHRGRTPKLLIIVIATLRHGRRTSGLVVIDVAIVRHGSRTPRWLDKSCSQSAYRTALRRIVASHSREKAEHAKEISELSTL